MTQKWKKYYEKSPYKEQIKRALIAIKTENFSGFDLKKLKGKQNTYRIRTGKVRIIFQVNSNSSNIIAINTRGDVY